MFLVNKCKQLSGEISFTTNLSRKKKVKYVLLYSPFHICLKEFSSAGTTFIHGLRTKRGKSLKNLFTMYVCANVIIIMLGIIFLP